MTDDIENQEHVSAIPPEEPSSVQIQNHAFEKSGLTEEEWEKLTDDQRNAFTLDAIDALSSPPLPEFQAPAPSSKTAFTDN